MPRNGSGTSSVVNTFVIDTIADPDEVNANFTDVADQLTNSLPRDGQAGMNAPLPLQNGTVELPALTFSSDPDTGIYRKGANQIGWSEGGIDATPDRGAVYAAKAGNYTALGTDSNAVHRYTAVATVTLTAAATLGANWHYTIIADGADVTIDPNGAETINGVATLRVPDGSYATIICSGSAFFAFVASSTTYTNCRLTLSGGNLLLSRFNGRRVTINGIAELIPSAGITLSASGLTPSTLYYIYAYMNSGTMTLEASTTANATDTATGIQIKTGDATRSLVGMARPVTGPAWVDSNQQRFVRSWYNDTGVSLSGVLSANTDAASTTPTKLSTNLDIEALLWSGEAFDVTASGSVFNNTADAGNTSTIAFDGTAETSGTISLTTAISQSIPFSVSSIKMGLSQGYHLATLFASTTIVSTGRWRGDADGRRVNIVGRINR